MRLLEGLLGPIGAETQHKIVEDLPDPGRERFAVGHLPALPILSDGG